MKTSFQTIQKFDPGIDLGRNDGATPVFYKHGRVKKIEETPAHKVIRMNYAGWSTNADSSGLCVGTVFTLPARPGFPDGVHMAGYVWCDNDERVIYPDIYSDIDSCARDADRHAERFANMERDNSERFERMALAELDCEEKLLEVQKAFALRHKKKFGGPDRVIDTIEELRKAREELTEATVAYEKGLNHENL